MRMAGVQFLGQLFGGRGKALQALKRTQEGEGPSLASHLWTSCSTGRKDR